jgi:hypothetical protein
MKDPKTGKMIEKILCVQVESLYSVLEDREYSEEELKTKALQVFKTAMENNQLELFGWDVMEELI